MTVQGAQIQIRRNTWPQWIALNPILASGELGLETDKERFRIGDGVTRFVDLDYYLTSKAILVMIGQALSNAGAGDGGASLAALVAHIESLTPHPAYDDGPSFLLLYENAKV